MISKKNDILLLDYKLPNSVNDTVIKKYFSVRKKANKIL